MSVPHRKSVPISNFRSSQPNPQSGSTFPANCIGSASILTLLVFNATEPSHPNPLILSFASYCHLTSTFHSQVRHLESTIIHVAVLEIVSVLEERARYKSLHSHYRAGHATRGMSIGFISSLSKYFPDFRSRSSPNFQAISSLTLASTNYYYLYGRRLCMQASLIHSRSKIHGSKYLDPDTASESSLRYC